jgi:hypothetical protein
MVADGSMHIEESDREKSFMQEGGAGLNEEYGPSTVNIESMFGAAPNTSMMNQVVQGAVEKTFSQPP